MPIRKIAVIIYRMLETGSDYSYGYCQDETERIRKAQVKSVTKKMNQFGIKIEELIPA